VPYLSDTDGVGLVGSGPSRRGLRLVVGCPALVDHAGPFLHRENEVGRSSSDLRLDQLWRIAGDRARSLAAAVLTTACATPLLVLVGSGDTCFMSGSLAYPLSSDWWCGVAWWSL
jgi:hypothetical protein